MGQRLSVLHVVLLRTQHRPESVARIVRTIVHGDGPLHHGMDALLDAPRRLPLHVPDRGEDLQHVGARHLGDRPATDAWEDVAFQTPPPRRGVRGMTPPALLLLHHAHCCGGEGWHILRAALVGQRVTAGPGELAVGARLLARLGERHQGDAAEAELAAAAFSMRARMVSRVLVAFALFAVALLISFGIRGDSFRWCLGPGCLAVRFIGGVSGFEQ